jgi:hypothetical protein
MKKFAMILFSAILMVGLAACSKNVSNTPSTNPVLDAGNDEDTVMTTKMGLGLVTTDTTKDANSAGDGTVQFDTTYAMVVLGEDDKITKVDIDTIQSIVKFDVAGKVVEKVTMSKTEAKDDYGMGTISGINKEWYKQVEAFEKYCVGKTIDEVLRTQLDPNKNSPVDLATSVTINVNEFITAIDNASKNLTTVTDGHLTGVAALTEFGTVDASAIADGKIDVVTSVVATGLNLYDKFVYLEIDEAQSSATIDAKGKVKTTEVLPSKQALKSSMGIVEASTVYGPWYEEIEAFKVFIKNELASDLHSLELHPETGAPINVDSNVTMSVKAYKAAIEKAVANATK